MSSYLDLQTARFHALVESRSRYKGPNRTKMTAEQKTLSTPRRYHSRVSQTKPTIDHSGNEDPSQELQYGPKYVSHTLVESMERNQGIHHNNTTAVQEVLSRARLDYTLPSQIESTPVDLEKRNSSQDRKHDIDLISYDQALSTPLKAQKVLGIKAPDAGTVTIHQDHINLKQSKSYPQAKLAAEPAGLTISTSSNWPEPLSFDSDSSNQSTAGYVASLRKRELMVPVAKTRTVTIPRLGCIYPPTPTITTHFFGERPEYDTNLLAPPPICYKKKQRVQQARVNAEKAMELRRSRSIVTPASIDNPTAVIKSSITSRRVQNDLSNAWATVLQYERQVFTKLDAMGF